MAHPSSAGRSAAGAIAVAFGLVAGILAFILIVVANEMQAKYAAVLFSGLIALIALPLVGNLRLVSLYGVLLLAPLGLRLSFLAHPKMGGAGAMFIDLVDPFILMLLAFQVRDRVQGYVPRFRVTPVGMLWGGMIALGVLSIIMGPLRSLALNETFRMAKLLVLMLVVLNELKTQAQFRHAIIAIAIGVALQGTVAITQYVLGHQIGLQFLGEASDEDIKALSEATLASGDFVYRVDGLLGHSNLLACYLAMYLPVSIALLLAPVSNPLKTLLAFGLLLGQPALVLTLSRTGWIDFVAAFAIVIAAGAVHPVSRRRFLAARMAILVVTVCIGVALSPAIIKRLLESDPNAVTMRLEWLATARDMVVANPVLGVGLNAYVYAQVPYGKDKTPEAMTDRYGDLWPAVHNSWMLTWTEQGTVGFAMWVALHLYLLGVGVKNLAIRDPMLHAMAAGLLGGLVAVMIDGLTSFFVRTEAPGRMFWILVGLILALGYWRRDVEGAVAVAEPVAPPPPVDPENPGGRWLPARPSILR